MLIIEPGTQFLLTYKLNNPSDTNTYYVQSKVYNAVSGALLSTVKLTDNGSKFYSKLWTAPTDGTANGLQVYVMTTVYTDSGYSTESTIYGTTVDNYIVRHLPTNNLGGFTTQVNAAVRENATDYRKIEEILRKVVSEIEQPEPPEKEEPYDDSALLEEIRAERDDHANRLVEIEEYTRNCVEDSAKRLEASFKGQIASIRDAVVSFLDRHSAQDDTWDSKMESQLTTIKDALGELLTEEKLEQHLEERETRAEERHGELMDEIGKPVPIVMSRKVQKENEEPKEKLPSERQMTIDRLLNLP